MVEFFQDMENNVLGFSLYAAYLFLTSMEIKR
jgi:hypothetical protein